VLQIFLDIVVGQVSHVECGKIKAHFFLLSKLDWSESVHKQKVSKKVVIPVPIFIGINSSRNPVFSKCPGCRIKSGMTA
jgi:hypothetical protein